MAGTYPLDASLTLQQISDSLTTHEQLTVEQLTAFGVDTSAAIPRNLATFINRSEDTGALLVVVAGAAASGTKILDNKTAFVSGKKLQVDVYRQAT